MLPDGVDVAHVRKRLRLLRRPNVTITDPPRDVVFERDVEVPARDGTILRVNVFRPEGDGPFPVLLCAHPYGKDGLPKPKKNGKYGVPFQLRMLAQSTRFSFSAWTGWEAPDPAVWVARGYAVVNCDLRGWGSSDGVGVLLSEQEARKVRDGELIGFEGSYGFDRALVTFGAAKASHRDVDTGRSLPWLPFHPDTQRRPLAPGEIVALDIELPPSATLFRAGEELRLDIQGQWFFPVNPLLGQFPAHYERSPRGTCVLSFGGAYDAALHVPRR